MAERILSIIQIADKLAAAYAQQRSPRLKPETALIASIALRAWCMHPEAKDIAMALCDVKGKCHKPCMACLGRANIVKKLYHGQD